MNRVADILPHNFQSLRGFTVVNGNAHDILLADKRENEIIVTVSIMKVQPIIKSDSTVHAADVSNHFLLFAFFFLLLLACCLRARLSSSCRTVELKKL